MAYHIIFANLRVYADHYQDACFAFDALCACFTVVTMYNDKGEVVRSYDNS